MAYYVVDKSIMIDYFYSNLKRAIFDGIDEERLKELFETSKPLNKYYNDELINRHKSRKYESITIFIRYNLKKYNINSEAEKYILFMFAVDPTFEAIKIYSESKKIKDVKPKMIKTFGIFDENLIRLEKFTIEKLLSESKRKEVNDILEQRTI